MSDQLENETPEIRAYDERGNVRPADARYLDDGKAEKAKPKPKGGRK